MDVGKQVGGIQLDSSIIILLFFLYCIIFYAYSCYFVKLLTKLLWSSGIGAPARVSAPGFEPWPLRNLHVGCSIRERRPLYGEPHGDALAAFMLTSISSLQARPSTKGHEALALGHII